MDSDGITLRYVLTKILNVFNHFFHVLYFFSRLQPGTIL